MGESEFGVPEFSGGNVPSPTVLTHLELKEMEQKHGLNLGVSISTIELCKIAYIFMLANYLKRV
ncbi:MAG: hypothetical protein Ct9H90mP11_06830 [Acidimicrobiales bacterium]|nr:MAG: hypothetical protein Ct9H90mP11_06830 [Acidimicrobiales bacterium]